jgi:hypothetical protein
MNGWWTPLLSELDRERSRYAPVTRMLCRERRFARFLPISHEGSLSPNPLDKLLVVLLLIMCCSRSLQHYRFAMPASALRAEASWSPKDAAAWKETDYESELKKLEKEAEERLDAKIEEMMTKIEATGAGK